jgi:hypothetical protein
MGRHAGFHEWLIAGQHSECLDQLLARAVAESFGRDRLVHQAKGEDQGGLLDTPVVPVNLGARPLLYAMWSMNVSWVASST